MRLERTPDGRRLVVERSVAAPPERAWGLLVDTEMWPEWGPTVASVDAGRRRIEAGTTGRVRIRGVGIAVPFEVTGFDEAVRRWTWDVARLPATGHRVRADGEGCRVGFEIPVAGAGYAPVCRRACRNLAVLAEGRE